MDMQLVLCLLEVRPRLDHHARVVSALVIMQQILQLIRLIVLEQLDDLFELREVDGHVEFLGLVGRVDWAWDSVVAGGQVLPAE